MLLTKQGKRIEALQTYAGFAGNDTGFAAELGIHSNTLYRWKVEPRKRPLRAVYWEKMEKIGRKKVEELGQKRKT